MNNIIKEIENWKIGIETGKDEYGIKVDGIGYTWKELKLLLDYITNLQQENERLKDQNINEILKKDLEICAKQYKKSDEKLEKYKSRIEKAIEELELWQPKNKVIQLEIELLLNILRGKDNE